MIYDLEEEFPDIPRKVLLAKLANLIKQNIISGCTCGCRGDFEIVDEIEKLEELEKYNNGVSLIKDISEDFHTTTHNLIFNKQRCRVEMILDSSRLTRKDKVMIDLEKYCTEVHPDETWIHFCVSNGDTEYHCKQTLDPKRGYISIPLHGCFFGDKWFYKGIECASEEEWKNGQSTAS